MTSQDRQRPLIEGVTTIANDLDWSDFQWGETSLIIRRHHGEEIKLAPLKSYKYYQVNQT
jgi:hypothetical protein